MSPPVRILLVEDSSSYAKLVTLLLTEEFGDRVAVRPAATLAEGLGALAAEGADCVLLDLTLPDGEGPGNVDAVRAADPSAEVVVLSGRGDPAIAEEVRRRGASAFVLKGSERRELFAALRAARARRAGPG